MLALLLNMGFAASRSGFIPPTPITNTVVPAGRSKLKRRPERYIVRIDGQEFVCSTLEGAQEVLRQAREMARQHAQTLANRQIVAANPLEVSLPEISGPPELRPALEATKVEMRQIYTDVFRDAEIAMLMAVSRRIEDDNDILMLLW